MQLLLQAAGADLQDVLGLTATPAQRSDQSSKSLNAVLVCVCACRLMQRPTIHHHGCRCAAERHSSSALCNESGKGRRYRGPVFKVHLVRSGRCKELIRGGFALPSVTASSTQKHKGELKLLAGRFCSCATSLQLNAAAAACAAAVSPEAAHLCS
jgi:hypothetical protein